jgi:hypothetical protein
LPDELEIGYVDTNALVNNFTTYRKSLEATKNMSIAVTSSLKSKSSKAKIVVMAAEEKMSKKLENRRSVRRFSGLLQSIFVVAI